MGALEGRVAIITGAGRGLGRAHALLFAREGARLVLNDAGTSPDGTGRDAAAAAAVADEVRALGGEAVADSADVSRFETGERLVNLALEAFGRLDVVVNNAGILRDRMLVNMSEQEWDAVIAVHLKGHFALTRFAAAHWRAEAKAGRRVEAAIVNSSSTSGLKGNPGQANYGAAKAGIAALTIIAAQELARYGVRVNAIAPLVRTRMTATVPGLAELLSAPVPGAFDPFDPANVSPLVAYLASSACTVTGRVFYVEGGRIHLYEPWHLGASIEKEGRWEIDELARELPAIVG
ncbi:MAG TPA: SDR family oxidoreductase [Acidimicrobiales bacterium]|nr:SDR family oxidoreductase [Acidimicrobiales bacterium]